MNGEQLYELTLAFLDGRNVWQPWRILHGSQQDGYVRLAAALSEHYDVRKFYKMGYEHGLYDQANHPEFMMKVGVEGDVFDKHRWSNKCVEHGCVPFLTRAPHPIPTTEASHPEQ